LAMKTKLEIEVDIPEGYDFVVYRQAFTGESFIDGKGNIATWGLGFASPCKYLIVIKSTEWVPIDLTKITMSMLPLAVRFRNNLKEVVWVKGCLMGIRHVFCADVRFVDTEGLLWDSCEVLEYVE